MKNYADYTKSEIEHAERTHGHLYRQIYESFLDYIDSIRADLTDLSRGLIYGSDNESGLHIWLYGYTAEEINDWATEFES